MPRVAPLMYSFSKIPLWYNIGLDCLRPATGRPHLYNIISMCVRGYNIILHYILYSNVILYYYYYNYSNFLFNYIDIIKMFFPPL